MERSSSYRAVNTFISVIKTNQFIEWRERNQQDATNLIFIIKLLSQHVSGIIMPIMRRTRVCTAAYGVLHWLWWLWLWELGHELCRTVTFTAHSARVPAPHDHNHHKQCRTPYAAVHTLFLLMMGIMMPETCWDKSLIINIGLVASCWFLSLHPTEEHQLNSVCNALKLAVLCMPGQV